MHATACMCRLKNNFQKFVLSFCHGCFYPWKPSHWVHSLSIILWKKCQNFQQSEIKKKVEENISIWQGPSQSNHLFTYHCLYKEDDLRRGSDHLTCSGEESLDHTYTLSLTKHLAALIAGEAGGTEDWWPSSGKEGNYGKSMRRKSDRELCVHREDHHPKTANRTDLPVSKMKMRRDFEFSCGIKRERGWRPF